MNLNLYFLFNNYDYNNYEYIFSCGGNEFQYIKTSCIAVANVLYERVTNVKYSGSD